MFLLCWFGWRRPVGRRTSGRPRQASPYPLGSLKLVAARRGVRPANLPLPSRLLKRVASRSPPGDLLNLGLPLQQPPSLSPPLWCRHTPWGNARLCAPRCTLLGEVEGQPLPGVSSL